MLLYITIFISKIIENSLGTLRLIVVASGKKNLGAILQFIITLVWIIVTGTVVQNISKDPLTILFFAFGSYIGSYSGSLIEEKLAMGSNLLMAIINNYSATIICNELTKKGVGITSFNGEGTFNKKKILLIFVSRKKQSEVTHIIKTIDKKAMIISERAKSLYGGYLP